MHSQNPYFLVNQKIPWKVLDKHILETYLIVASECLTRLRKTRREKAKTAEFFSRSSIFLPKHCLITADRPVSNGFIDFIKNIVKNIIERASKDSSREIVS